MNRKSKNTQINEIKTTPAECVTKPKDIANHLNKHFTEVGINLASKIPEPSDGITFQSYLTKTNTVFKLRRVKPSRVLKLLTTVDTSKATNC